MEDLDEGNELAAHARDLVREGRLADALVVLNRAITLAPDQAHLLCARGRVRYEMGERVAPLTDYARAMELDPSSADPYLQRGQLHNAWHDSDSAIADYSMAEELAGHDRGTLYEVFRNRGAAYLNSEQYGLALDDLNRALRMNPDRAETLADRGYAYWHLNRGGDAYDDFLGAHALDPYSIYVLSRFGMFLLDKSQFEPALKAFNRGLELKPDDFTCLRGKGRTLFEMRQYAEAAQFIYLAIQAKPLSSAAHDLVGLLTEAKRLGHIEG